MQLDVSARSKLKLHIEFVLTNKQARSRCQLKLRGGNLVFDLTLILILVFISISIRQDAQAENYLCSPIDTNSKMNR